MTKPNFLIVGAAKSGTTSAYEYLRQHPDVYMPDWKEPSFFAPPEAGGVTTEEEYLALFEKADKEKTIGEASVAYLYAPDAPQKIMDFLGKETKIIIFLRNPVDMVYSHWGHQVREGFEGLSFEQALEAEKDRMQNTAFQNDLACWIANVAYIDRAKYSGQISRYDKIFPKKNIKIFIYEEFFKPDLPLWEELCDFLGITPTFKPEGKIYNAAGKMRSDLLRRILRQRMAWKEPFKAIMPLKLRLKIKIWLEKQNRKNKKYPPLDVNTRKKLEITFKDEVNQIEKYLGRTLKDVWFSNAQSGAQQ